MSLLRGVLAIAVMGGFVAFADPGHADVKISTKATSNMTCSGGVCSPTAKKGILNVTDLANMLAGADVTVRSGNLAQDIEIDAALTWTSTHRLTLDSYRSIAFNQPVAVAGTGALTITANDGGSNGDFAFLKKGSVKFWDTNSSLTINNHNYVLYSSLKDFVKHFRHFDGTGKYYAQAKNWNAARKIYAIAPIKDFEGTFEGLGNTISHLTIRDSTTHAALIGSLVVLGTVRDVSLTAIDIAGTATLAGQSVAGLVDGAVGTILNCHVDGQISATGPQAHVGGLAAHGTGTILRSSANVTISAGGSEYSGGLIALNLNDGIRGDIRDSYSAGQVNGGGVSGGLIGAMQGGSATLSNSFSSASVTGGGTGSAGGLIGLRGDSAIAITTAYSTGAVSSGSGAPVGGSIGEDDAAGSGISHDYWDLDTSGISNPHQGAGNVPDDPGIAGLTDAQLKSGLPAGFDPKVWAIDPKINNGYPYLIDNPPMK